MATLESTLAGRYRLEEVVGRGGMSTVYRATDEVLGRTVAVKILLPALADQDPTYSVRFEREARAAAALATSAVVTVYDTGVDAGSHYIVMEYIEGRSLDEILRDRRPLDPGEALRITERIAQALAVAHAAGILHRDIKPANVMVASDGTVKVLDFGIARRLDATTITQAASVVGTAAYMAPERALGQPGDERADIYSLGCLLYAMLTGSPPFGGEISAAVLHQQINASPSPPSQRRRGLTPALDALVLNLLAKAPEARPASAAEVRDQIAALSQPRVPTTAAAAAVPANPPTAATVRLSRDTAATVAASPRRQAIDPRPRVLTDHRRRALVMALLTGAVALLAVALLSPGAATNRAASTRHHTATTVPPAATTPKPTTSNPAQTTPPPPSHKKPKPPKPKPDGGAGPPPGHAGKPPGHDKAKGG
ncbi:MAG TPA: protein kinase [Solirubrobacteraceae bacterium]|nr:protein kinase [Solirubrobacteraceae bacterium]